MYSLIPYYISSLIYCHLNCLPYALLRSIIQTNKFGFFLGIINCCVTAAQLVSGVMMAVMKGSSVENGYDTTQFLMIFVFPLSLLSVAISFALFLTYRNHQKINERPMYDSFDQSSLMNESSKLTSVEMN